MLSVIAREVFLRAHKAGLLSEFKKEHPEYLFGTRNKLPRFGHGTGIDYALAGMAKTNIVSRRTHLPTI